MEIITCCGNHDNLPNVKTWFQTSTKIVNTAILVYDGIQCRPEDEKFCQWFEIAKSGPVASMQAGYEQLYHDTEIVGFIHDDLIIHERGWDERVLAEFADPSVHVVGFGGATGLGTDDIYKTPYELRQLIRVNYCSNVRDAENHGFRYTGSMDAAVLDGFSLFVRKSLLDAVGGWPTEHLVFHMYDAWLACVAARMGVRTRMVGVDCHHLGGRTSTKAGYNDWLKEKYGKTDVDIHREAHEWIYKEFRDVLPIRVTQRVR